MNVSKTCETCGAILDLQAKRCPHCGATTDYAKRQAAKKKSKAKGIVIAILAAAVLAGLLFWFYTLWETQNKEIQEQMEKSFYGSSSSEDSSTSLKEYFAVQ